MKPQYRVLLMLGLGFGIGFWMGLSQIAPLWCAAVALPMGAFAYIWILFGDVMSPMHALTADGRATIRTVLSGSTNLGSRGFQLITLVGMMVRMLTPLALGYLTPLTFGMAPPLPALAFAPFLVPMVLWWVAQQVLLRKA